MNDENNGDREAKIQTSAQKTKYQANALSISVLASRTENNICSIA